MIDWTQFQGQYIKWDAAGQSVAGQVKAIRIGSYKGKDYPELVLETEDGTRILSASQAALQRRLADEAPDVGDRLEVEYLGEGEARPGQSPVKLFDVEVSPRSKTAPDGF